MKRWYTHDFGVPIARYYFRFYSLGRSPSLTIRMDRGLSPSMSKIWGRKGNKEGIWPREYRKNKSLKVDEQNSAHGEWIREALALELWPWTRENWRPSPDCLKQSRTMASKPEWTVHNLSWNSLIILMKLKQFKLVMSSSSRPLKFSAARFFFVDLLRL